MLKHKPISPWSPDAVARLKSLHALGWSFSRIAAALSETFVMTFSRNATIGKAKRLGLCASKQPNVAAPRRPKIDAAPMRRIAVAGPEPIALGIKLADARAGECRWIAGEPTAEATICGCRARAGAAFCDYHLLRVYDRAATQRYESKRSGKTEVASQAQSEAA